MDIVSHGLIGRMLVTRKNTHRDIYWVCGFAVLPDLFQLPLYAFLGYIKHRPFWVPLTSDWDGFRSAYPMWAWLWEIPHSLFFLLVVIVPLAFYFKLNRMVIWAYFSHLFVDLFTHSGEWAMKPLFPLDFTFNGFTDAWAWNYYWYPVAWLVLLGMVVISDRLRAISPRT